MKDKINVLIVEDNLSHADFIASLIDKTLYNVEKISDGAVAFDLLQQNESNIDIVLIDYHLPGLDGIQLMEEISKLGKLYGIIFITSDKKMETIIKAMKAGAHDFVYKSPALGEELPAIIEKVSGIYFARLNKKKYDEQLKILSSAVEQSGSSIVITDLDGTIEYVNTKFIENTGYTFEEARGNNPRILKSGDKDKNYYENLWQTIKSGNTWKGEFANKKKNGDIFYEDAIISPVKDDNGEIIKFIAIKDNVTEKKLAQQSLKESEEKYRQLFEFAPIGISITDNDGNLVTCNKEWVRLLDVPLTEQQNRKISDFNWQVIRKDGMPMLLDEFANARALKENKMAENVEMGIIKTDNNILWINATAAPLPTGSGVIITYVDISEKIQREKLIKEYSHKLEELNATKDRFFSIIAHDLKNPFNSIFGFTDLLLKNLHKYDSAKVEHFLQIIKNSSTQTYELLENLLTWANAQRGRIEFQPEVIDLNLRINENLKFVENMALKKNIALTTNIIDDAIVFGDRNMINTILRNLFTNAIKFTYQNGNISVSVTEKEKVYEISVKDNGIGIEKENIEKLFRIDSKYAKPGTAAEKGSGLGLILCKEFVEKHEGTLKVESIIGQGSNFIFTLPKSS